MNGNGKKCTFKKNTGFLVKGGGTLTITNLVALQAEDQTGDISPFHVEGNAKLVLNKGSISVQTYVQYGSLEAKNVAFSFNDPKSLHSQIELNSGSVSITGGSFKGTNSAFVKSTAKCKISGTNISATNNNITVHNKYKHYALVENVNGGTMTLENVKFTMAGTDHPVVNGSNANSPKVAAILNDAYASRTCTMTMKNCSVTQKKNGSAFSLSSAVTNWSVLSMENCTVKTQTVDAVTTMAYAKTTIKNGTFSSGANCFYTEAKATLTRSGKIATKGKIVKK